MQPLQIFLNPTAGGGQAAARWAEVEDGLYKEGVPFDLHRLEEGGVGGAVAAALAQGHRDLVAAGGDGTVQAVCHAAMRAPAAAEVRLGAIGIGTSNDFHKPVDPDSWFRGVPVRLDPAGAARRAAYRVETEAGAFHYLQNSSVGLLARGTAWVNQPPLLLRPLKWLWYPGLVQLLSIVNALTHAGVEVRVEAGGEREEGRMSGVTLLRQAHLGGGISFLTRLLHTDREFEVVCLRKVDAAELPEVLEQLAREGPRDGPRMRVLRGPEVELTFPRPERVEFDGEVVESAWARYRVLPDAVSLMGPGLPA